MKIKLDVKFFVYGAVVLVCLAVLALICLSRFQFADVKPVYQGF
ncbi:MAG TPA: hypothetical protein VKV04_18425 [Verrucomicrobiae bacterium]|nr:hypothetical protein [Verrucomicrobiae bacterium]